MKTEIVNGIKRITCQILIVGGGPAGGMAAKWCAKGGLDTLLIEKKAEVGAPLRCAEGVSKAWLDEVGIVPDPTWIRGDMKGAILKSPDRTTFQLDESKAGAKVMMRPSATDVIRDENGKLIGVKAIEYGEPIEIYCDCIVGADGYESQVGRWAGIDTKLKLSDIDSCIQYRMVNADVAPDYCEFIIGSEAPGGYIWIFPKGNGVANVGIGVIGTEAKKRPGLAK